VPRDDAADEARLTVLNFFQELARKLAERWVGLLVLPGALFVATAWAGWYLGWDRAWDLPGLVEHVKATGTEISRWPVATQVLLVLVTSLGIGATGAAVQALAGLTRAVWLGNWPAPLSRPVVVRRQRQWDARTRRRHDLQRQYPPTERTPAQQQAIDHAAARVVRLSPARPGKPTWMGDRLHAVEQVAHDRYGLDLTYGWPRLWLVLPEPSRAEITAAHTAFVSAVAVASWAWPYLALTAVWWPMIVIAATVGTAGWLRGRVAARDLSTSSESAIDLHGRALAVALGVATHDTTGPLTPTEGAAITAIVRKGR
jgi:hypothetical protein